MTVETTRQRTIQFLCDDCGQALDTERFRFPDALDVMRAQGWRAVKDGDGWRHLCEDCA